MKLVKHVDRERNIVKEYYQPTYKLVVRDIPSDAEWSLCADYKADGWDSELARGVGKTVIHSSGGDCPVTVHDRVHVFTIPLCIETHNVIIKIQEGDGHEGFSCVVSADSPDDKIELTLDLWGNGDAGGKAWPVSTMKKKSRYDTRKCEWDVNI